MFEPAIACFGFLLLFLPLVLCIILFSKLGALKQQIALLEGRLTQISREVYRKRAPGSPAAEQDAQPAVPGAAHSPAQGPALARLLDRRDEMHGAMHPPAYQPAGSKPVAPAAPMPAKPVIPSHAPPAVVAPPAAPVVPPPVMASAPPAPVPASSSLPPAALPPSYSVQPRSAPPRQEIPLPVFLRRPAGMTLEEYFFKRVSVVIGAIACAVAGIWTVKIGIDKGWFTPFWRDLGMVLIGLTMIALGQLRRRREPFWAQGMVAAGVVAIFAGVFAATMLHHLLPPTAGFVLLALTTAGTVLMSLQNWAPAGGNISPAGNGSLIATLGLIGGFLTPILIHTNEHNTLGLFGYLILLHAGLIAVTRVRGWSILAAITTLFSSLWVLAWMLLSWVPGDGPILGMFLLASVGTTVMSTFTDPGRWRGGPSGVAAMLLTWLSVALGLCVACVLLGRSGYSNLEWAYFAALAAGAFVLARLRPAYEGLAWLASAVLLAMLLAWAGPHHPGGMDLERYQAWLAGLGAATVLAAYGCLWKSVAPYRWSLLSAAAAIAYVLAAYFTIPLAPRPDAWAFLPLAGALLLIVLAVPVYFRRAAIRSGEGVLASFALATLALLAAAPPMAFSESRLTVCWSVLLPVAALAAWRLRIPALLGGVTGMLALVLCRGLMLAPLLSSDDPAHTLLWNPIVWSYGSILLSTAISVWLVERVETPPPFLAGLVPAPATLSGLLQALAAAAAVVLLTLEVRWGFHPGRLDALALELVERGSFAISWFAFAAALVWIGLRMGRRVLVRFGEVVAVAGMLYAAVVLLLAGNPLFWPDRISSSLIFNQLMFVYGLPAALCALLAFLLDDDRTTRVIGTLAGFMGLLLLFALVTWQVRHGFARERLGAGAPDFTEWGTYAVAWLALGAVLLAAGRALRRRILERGGVTLAVAGGAYAVAVPCVLMSPFVHHQWVGAWPVFNHLLYVYGVPVALAGGVLLLVHPSADRLFKPSAEGAGPGWRQVRRMMIVCMGILLFVLLTTEVRQGFQGEYLNYEGITFHERETYPIAWFAAGAGLMLVGAWRKVPAAAQMGGIFAAVSLGFELLVCAVAFNPLMTHDSVGARVIVNGLLYGYGIPAVGFAVLAHVLWRRKAAGTAAALAWGSAIGTLLLCFVLLTTEVQHFFRGDHLGLGACVTGEFTAYTWAWGIMGAILLATGLGVHSALLRYASLVVLLVTTCKAFIFDMADLRDFERVLSFAGLGVTLMGLAFFYTYVVNRWGLAKAPERPAP